MKILLTSLSKNLEFLSKSKSAFISETVRTGFLQSVLVTQNTFIWDTVPDGVITTKFLTCRLFAESTGDFKQKLLSRHFWRPSKISA